MTSWFRSWHGAPMDHKWLVVARRAETTPGVVSAIVWALFDYASQASPRGCIAGFDAETYAAYSGFPQETVEAVLCALAEKGIIEGDGQLTNWEKRQSSRDDDSTERVRRFRANRAGSAVTHGVTHGNAVKPTVTQSNAPDTDIDTDPETTNSSDDELSAMPHLPATEPLLEPATAQPKTPRSVTNPSAHQAVFGALAEVCVLDPKLKAAQLGKTAKQLIAAGYDAAQVAAFGEWFRCVDWRGQRGSPPTLAQVAELIKQSTAPRVQHPVPQERTNGNGNGRYHDQRDRNGGLPKPPVTAADQAYIDSLPAEWRQ